MDGSGGSPADKAISDLASAHRSVGVAQRRVVARRAFASLIGTAGSRRLGADVLEAITECDRLEAWRNDGLADMAEWLSGRLGISRWTARRRIGAAYALPGLPRITTALEEGVLPLEKVVELCRFATPHTERKLITWAKRVSLSTVGDRADRATRPAKAEVVEAEDRRFLSFWWIDEGRSLQIVGALPADQGAAVASAIDRLAGRLPDIVTNDDQHRSHDEALEVRRADALYAMASARIADDQDADRATVVVHADLYALIDDRAGCEIENGPPIHPEAARRLSCDGRIQVALHDRDSQVVGLGRLTRTPSPALLRLLRHRDRGCTFPNCGTRRFLHAHHITHWIWGGETNLDNLVLTCSFHHRLVHENGWQVTLARDGDVRWFKPNGNEYEPCRDLDRELSQIDLQSCKA